jgi:hypothetical protein
MPTGLCINQRCATYVDPLAILEASKVGFGEDLWPKPQTQVATESDNRT